MYGLCRLILSYVRLMQDDILSAVITHIITNICANLKIKPLTTNKDLKIYNLRPIGKSFSTNITIPAY